MMKVLSIPKNKHFIGREFELDRLNEIKNQKTARIIVTYGRRRVGKTEFIEQGLRDRHIIKFEGIEGKSEQEQMALVVEQLATYTGEKSLGRVRVNNWTDVFL